MGGLEVEEVVELLKGVSCQMCCWCCSDFQGVLLLLGVEVAWRVGRVERAEDAFDFL